MQRYDRHLMDGLAADLDRAGRAAWNIEYRRVGLRAGGGWPATFDDVSAAIDHLAELDAPLDLARVAAVGHSAGGHLALWAAGRKGARRAAHGGGGPGRRLADLEQAAAQRVCGGMVEQLLDGPPDQRARSLPRGVARPAAAARGSNASRARRRATTSCPRR